MLPVFRDLECCSSPHGFARPAIQNQRPDLAVCADTKFTVDRGLQAAETGINDCISQYEFVALQRGCGFSPGIARTPHHAREARASYRRPEFP
jgi:hypothetical protein